MIYNRSFSNWLNRHIKYIRLKVNKMNNNKELENTNSLKKDKIIETINLIRPYIINDGGNIEFIDYENNIVYIKIMGNCNNCQMLDYTLNELILTSIKEIVPEVEGIKIVES